MSFLRTVLAVSTSFAGYRAVRDLPLSSSIKYLVKVLTILVLVLAASLIPWFLGRTREFSGWVDRTFPEFSLQDGRIATAVEQPYVWGDQAFRFILDTTGKTTEPDPQAVQGILFQADRFTLWITSTNTPERTVHRKTQSLVGFPDGRVDGAYFRRLIRSFIGVGLPLSILMAILVGLLSALLQAVLFSVVAGWLEQSFGSALRLPQLLNIAIHAVTPAAIIVTAYLAMRLEGINLWLIYLIAYGVFLVGGTNAARDDHRRVTPEEEPL